MFLPSFNYYFLLFFVARQNAYGSMLQNCAKACDRWLNLEKAQGR
jgi:hypothetical protein